MKLVFQSKRVNVAILLGEPVPDVDDEEYVTVGGSFEPASDDDDVLVFGLSPVRA